MNLKVTVIFWKYLTIQLHEEMYIIIISTTGKQVKYQIKRESSK